MRMDYKLTVALIYDFDGTLSPGNMQEYDFIPAVGKSNREFWNDANMLAEQQDADMVLAYMAKMIQEAKSKGLSLKREAFQESGRRVTLYKGVASMPMEPLGASVSCTTSTRRGSRRSSRGRPSRTNSARFTPARSSTISTASPIGPPLR